MTATTSTWMHHQLARARPILAAEGPSMLRIVVASVVAWQDPVPALLADDVAAVHGDSSASDESRCV